MDVKATEGKFSAVTGKAKQEFEKTKESIGIIMKSSIDYEFRTTIIKEFHTIDDIREICSLIDGSKNYYLQKYRDEDSKESRSFMNPYSKNELEDIKEIVKNEFKITNVDVRASY
jgi:pyruvate formate lyase activating enzyme